MGASARLGPLRLRLAVLVSARLGPLRLRLAVLVSARPGPLRLRLAVLVSARLGPAAAAPCGFSLGPPAPNPHSKTASSNLRWNTPPSPS